MWKSTCKLSKHKLNTKNICDYLNKTEDKEMVSYALENSEYYYDGLPKITI